LADRVALVTGAGGGIGAATAEELARAGAMVLCVDINESALRDRHHNLAEQGLKASWAVLDITDEAAIAAAVADLVAEHGALDIVVAAHGMNSVDDAQIADLDAGLFKHIIDVNLGGVVLVAKYCAPHLVRSANGVFIAISSIGAMTPPAGPAYAASKGGMMSFVRSLSHELAPAGVRCLTISPGSIDTQMLRISLAKKNLTKKVMAPGSIGRVGQPAEIAKVARFLASDDASYVAGSNLTVDGGATPF
jgi:NAD(P)-dependent dehydrogenase (short-subunit alcohol dehydrogenase family)